MRAKISDFVGRLLKCAYPDATAYTYFRPGNHGFENCIEIPAFTVYLAHMERERSIKLLVTATQCNVVLPQAFIGRIAHAVKRAEEEARRGHLKWKENLTPNMDPEIAVYKSIGDTEGAKRAVEDYEAKEASRPKGEPKSYAPKPPPPKASAPSGSAPSTSSSSTPNEPKSKPAYKAMPTSAPAAKSTRPSQSDKPHQTPQYKKKRTD